ncbi:deoxyribose-phosphate aldolase/phospho-2-dehydro-3-deoxyheptonate aldolase [Hydrogenobaculum sp. Y04AAS1]|uniref:aldolase n=1 Tax=Hydrogenobaculum sp. (strain Y04AAS1) TaxID=380749 RepID=UPI00015BCFB9|nr:deoxyribose-phosphate aldolase/phospho-2-dehydro-3-deoxyheptonate aldolase [Hydrogenobaculum sp. Y04AAS1]HCT67192.1 aldolase [Hydrogenobaculum sp.]
MLEVIIPANVSNEEEFLKNFNEATKNTGNLMLFAGDQKIEHLNKDFYGEGIAKDDANPEHLFKIASKGEIGIFATQLGLITRYAKKYPNVPYLVKVNSKTNLVPFEQRDPISLSLHDFDKILDIKQKGIKILGVGYTVYLGSEFEHVMLKEASELVYKAHKNNMIAVLWMYPKGKAVKNEHDPELIAGAAGVAACLGADFAKIKVPKQEGKDVKELLHIAVEAAGNTGLICEGGSKEGVLEFLKELYLYKEAGVRGNGTGRNIHQRPLKEAIAMTKAISAITLYDKTPEEAYKIFQDNPL